MRSVAIALLVATLPLTAGAHGGGLDRNGGHHNRKTGGYHCHREPCFSNQDKAKAAPSKARKPEQKKNQPAGKGGEGATL